MTGTETSTAPAAAPASLWEDFIDILYAPTEVFNRRRNAGFGLVLLIVVVLIALLFFASQGPLSDAMAAEFRRAMERGGQSGPMSAEQQAQAQRMGQIFGMAAMVIGYPIAILVTGLLLWAIGKAFGFVGTAGMAILVVTYAQVPRILQTAAGLLQGLLLNPQSLAATAMGPARFVDPETTSAVLLALLMRLDVFYIWSTILIAIGAHVVGRVPKGQAYLLAAIIWIVGAIPTVLPALLQG